MGSSWQSPSKCGDRLLMSSAVDHLRITPSAPAVKTRSSVAAMAQMGPRCSRWVDLSCSLCHSLRVQSSLAVMSSPWWQAMALTESRWERRLALCAQLLFLRRRMGQQEEMLVWLKMKVCSSEEARLCFPFLSRELFTALYLFTSCCSRLIVFSSISRSSPHFSSFLRYNYRLDFKSPLLPYIHNQLSITHTHTHKHTTTQQHPIQHSSPEFIQYLYSLIGMSRHSNVSKMVSQGKYDDEDYSDNEQRDLNDDEWQMVDNLLSMFPLQESEAIKLLESEKFNFDKVVDKIKKNLQKEREKEEKKAREKEEREAKRREKEKQEQLARQKEREEVEVKKTELVHRKSSQDEPIVSVRKSSYVVEDYFTDHYNSEYPSLGMSKDFKPSNTVNIVVVGHVDSGKSTLVGIFLKEASYLDKKEVHRNEKESREIGKESFKHAWVTDSTEEERKRGVTIDVGVKKIELEGKNIVFLDSPGHREFIPNMITGAAQADYAILVIDTDNFETSFVGGGQTKEHAYIVKSLGVHKLIVAMNKMDRIEWNVERFTAIKRKLQHYLLQIGFTEEAILFVPISAINAINITPKSVRKFQAEGVVYNQSFMETIANLDMPPRPIDKPFRMTITNIYESQYGKLKGHCLSGKIEGGVIKKDEKLIILPLDTQCLVKEILISNEKVKEAVVGDNIDLQIKLIDETAFEAIKPGFVLSSLKYTIPVTKKIVVEALALDFELPVLRGTEVVIYIATNKCPARITKINFIYNPSNGTIIKKNPKMIKANDCAQIQIELQDNMCAQLFVNYKIFGRVIIREKKETLFVGTIKMIK